MRRAITTSETFCSAAVRSIRRSPVTKKPWRSCPPTNRPTTTSETSCWRGQSDAALVHFQKALKNRPEHELTYNNIGSTLAGRGQIDDAIVFFRKAVELNPDFVDAHDNLGRALASRGRLDEAAVHFRTSLELRPRDAAARENLDRVMSQKADQAAGSTERRP